MTGIGGWLLVYLIVSVPLLVFCAAALSGWYFDYPMALFVAIFMVLASPLVLLVMEVPSAPAWNIAMLWVGAGLVSLRVLTGVLGADKESLTRPAVAILAATVLIAIAFAAVWTTYFLVSDRVAATFA